MDRAYFVEYSRNIHNNLDIISKVSAKIRCPPDMYDINIYQYSTNAYFLRVRLFYETSTYCLNVLACVMPSLCQLSSDSDTEGDTDCYETKSWRFIQAIWHLIFKRTTILQAPWNVLILDDYRKDRPYWKNATTPFVCILAIRASRFRVFANMSLLVVIFNVVYE